MSKSKPGMSGRWSVKQGIHSERTQVKKKKTKKKTLYYYNLVRKFVGVFFERKGERTSLVMLLIHFPIFPTVLL